MHHPSIDDALEGNREHNPNDVRSTIPDTEEHPRRISTPDSIPEAEQRSETYALGSAESVHRALPPTVTEEEFMTAEQLPPEPDED